MNKTVNVIFKKDFPILQMKKGDSRSVSVSAYHKLLYQYQVVYPIENNNKRIKSVYITMKGYKEYFKALKGYYPNSSHFFNADEANYLISIGYASEEPEDYNKNNSIIDFFINELNNKSISYSISYISLRYQISDEDAHLMLADYIAGNENVKNINGIIKVLNTTMQ